MNIMTLYREIQQPGMIAKAGRSGDTGCGTEEYRHRMRRDGAQAWHWRPWP